MADTERKLGIIQVNSDLLTNLDGFMDGNTNLTEVNCPFPYVTTAVSAFANCTSLNSFSVKFPELQDATKLLYKSSIAVFTTGEEGWNKVTDATSMLEGCTELTSARIRMNSVTNVSNIFANTSNKLTNVYLHMQSLGTGSNDESKNGNLKLPNSVNSLECHLANVQYLTLPSNLTTATLDLPKMSDGSCLNINGTALSTLTGKFNTMTTFGGHSFPTSLTTCSLDFTNTVDGQTVGSLINGSNLFKDCSSLAQLSFQTGSLSSLQNGTSMFQRSSLKTWGIDLPSLTTGTYMFQYCQNLSFVNSNLGALTNGEYMFEKDEALSSVYTNLSSLIDGSHMFANCSKLTNLKSQEMVENGSERAEINFENLKNGSYMFANCGKIKEFYPTLPSLQNGSHMFSNCIGFTSFGAASVKNLPKMENGSNMFEGCYNMTSVRITTPEMVDGSYMFSNCKGLNYSSLSIDSRSISSDGTVSYSKLSNGSYMFSYCNQLQSVNINVIDLRSLENGSNMFANCSNLTTFLSSLESLKTGEYMFHNCKLDEQSLTSISAEINDLSSQINREDPDNVQYLDESYWTYKTWDDNGTNAAVVTEGDQTEQSNIKDNVIPVDTRRVIHVDIDASVPTDKWLSFVDAMDKKGWIVRSCSNREVVYDISVDNKSSADKSFVEDIASWRKEILNNSSYEIKLTKIMYDDTNNEGLMYGTAKVYPKDSQESGETGDEGTQS